MSQFSVDGSRVVVVGAARSGIAAAELLTRRGARVILTETRKTLEQEQSLRASGIELELGGHRADTLHTADLVVLSPGVSPQQSVVVQARKYGVPIISEIELAARWLRGRVVAVTGTKGKTMTALLTGRMFEAVGRRAIVGGNIGTALSSQVDASTPDAVHVVEVSSFQLELTHTFRPWISVCLNISPDHLDRHKTIDDYVNAKARIFSNQTKDDAMVINADDSRVLEMSRSGLARSVQFAVNTTVSSGVSITEDAIIYRSSEGARTLVPLSAVQVPGRHLLSNVLAATAVGAIAGIDSDAMTRVVQSYTGAEHVLEFVREVGGVRYVNDSKATNIAAAQAAIECFPRGVVVILGGHHKGGSFDALRDVLIAANSSVVAIGEARAHIHSVFDSHVEVECAETMMAAVQVAQGLAKPGSTVLLAPACASFDMFEDFAARGRAFKEAVARLVPKSGLRGESDQE